MKRTGWQALLLLLWLAALLPACAPDVEDRAAAQPGECDSCIFDDTIPPVSGFSATASSGTVYLLWSNPDDPGFAGVMIRHGTSEFPALPSDGS